MHARSWDTPNPPGGEITRDANGNPTGMLLAKPIRRHEFLVGKYVGLVGTLLVSLADTVGRNVIAPDQVPAGMITALIGTPYFVWLLWRSRA